jgi:hypothetical protein
MHGHGGPDHIIRLATNTTSTPLSLWRKHLTHSSQNILIQTRMSINEQGLCSCKNMNTSPQFKKLREEQSTNPVQGTCRNPSTTFLTFQYELDLIWQIGGRSKVRWEHRWYSSISCKSQDAGPLIPQNDAIMHHQPCKHSQAVLHAQHMLACNTWYMMYDAELFSNPSRIVKVTRYLLLTPKRMG